MMFFEPEQDFNRETDENRLELGAPNSLGKGAAANQNVRKSEG